MALVRSLIVEWAVVAAALLVLGLADRAARVPCKGHRAAGPQPVAPGVRALDKRTEWALPW